MAYFKIVRKTLEINGSNRKISVDLRAEVFSYDKNVNKFLFELTSKEAEIDLTDATVRVLLTYVGNDGKKGMIEDCGGVEVNTTNQIYYLLPEKLRGYDGTVVMGLYVDLPSGEAIDIQNVQFRMFKSSIDDGAGVAGVIYFKSFEEWLCQVKEKALQEIQNIDEESERITKYADTKIKEYDDKFIQSNQKMSELQQSQNELSDQLDETNKKIDEADVYRKDEVFNKPESSANVIYQVIGKEKVELTITLDLLNKEAGSQLENPHWLGARSDNPISNPNTFTTEVVQARYDQTSKLDGNVFLMGLSNVNNIAQICFKADVLKELKRILGEEFFATRGASTDAEYIESIHSIVKELTFNVDGYGQSSSGYKLSATIWDGIGNRWSPGIISSNSEKIARLKRTASGPSIANFINNDGITKIVSYAEPSDGITASTIVLDYVNLVLKVELSVNEHIKSMIATNHVENLATQEEAETGKNNSKTMTPLRVFQAIAEWTKNKFVSITENQTILGTKNFQDGILVAGKKVVLTKDADDYAMSDSGNNSSIIGGGYIKLFRRGDLVYMSASFKLAAEKFNQGIWFNPPSWARPIETARINLKRQDGTSALFIFASPGNGDNTIICSDKVAADTWLNGSACWLAKDPY
ncbi:BppU family phage baseplate upper protein [Enterococcus gilvus]|uniref:BppU family phage baseplate upper protein n=1 Tax=Enterococcus gilvus TaxID=160453 RepID=UPI003D6A81AD